MKTKCYSVRLESLTPISAICYKAVAFDGSSALIPARFVFGQDYGVQKSDAYWIAAWILEKKDLQYSTKKSAWFDEAGMIMPETTVTDHIPSKIKPKGNNIIESLKK